MVAALDKKGHTALHWARLHSKGAEKLLLERGAKPCAWNCAKCKRRRDEPPAGSGGGGSSGGGSVSNGSGSGSSHSGGQGGGGALADPPAKQGIAATRPKQPVTPQQVNVVSEISQFLVFAGCLGQLATKLAS